MKNRKYLAPQTKTHAARIAKMKINRKIQLRPQKIKSIVIISFLCFALFVRFFFLSERLQLRLTNF